MVGFMSRFITNDISIGSFLCSIPGLGFRRINFICAVFGVKFKTRVFHCRFDKLEAMERFIRQNYVVDSDLSREVAGNLSAKVKSGSYHGIRLDQHLPSRGQRTKTNAKTAKSGRSINLSF